MTRMRFGTSERPLLAVDVLARCDRAFWRRSGNRARSNGDHRGSQAGPAARPRGKMQRISAYILAYNEAEKVAAAVSSVLWADEIVVVDSGSTDGTAEIAERLGARVVQIPSTGSAICASCDCGMSPRLDFQPRIPTSGTPEARDEILLDPFVRGGFRRLPRAAPQFHDGTLDQGLGLVPQLSSATALLAKVHCAITPVRCMKDTSC